MLPQPAGVWGMSADFLATIPGYGPDVAKNRTEAREIMPGSAMGPTSGSPSKSPRATSRPTATPP